MSENQALDPAMLDGASIPTLCEYMRSDVPSHRGDAACALGDRLRCLEVDHLEEETLAVVRTLLKDPVPMVRLEAAICLAEAKDHTGTDILLEAARHRAFRLDAVRALGTMGDPAAIPSLLGMLDRWLFPWADKLQAAAALCSLGEPRGQAYLELRLGARRKIERAAAIHFIGESKHPNAQEILSKILQDPQHPHRDVAARALGLLGGDAARKALEAERPNARDELLEDIDSALARIALPAK